MKSDLETINSTLVSYELNNGNEIPCIESKDLSAILNITESDLNYIVNQTRMYCKSISSMTLYNNHFFFNIEDNVEAASVVGVSFICKNLNHLNTNLLECLPIFQELALDWFYKVDFYKKHSTTRRNAMAGKNAGISWELASEYNVTKGIQSDLKTPKEDVEDVNHLFYKKGVVITGTFDKFQLRNEMAKLLHDVGADINASISKKTNFVVVGKEAGPKKLEKIALLNIPIISEEKFYEIFGIE